MSLTSSPLATGAKAPHRPTDRPAARRRAAPAKSIVYTTAWQRYLQRIRMLVRSA